MKKFIEHLLFGLITVVVIAIYQEAKSEGKILGKQLKQEGKEL